MPRRCPLILPQLAIHLDRNVNENGLVLNKQDHLAVLAGVRTKTRTKKHGYLEQMLKKRHPYQELLAFDLFLYPLEPARLAGEQQELLSAYRIENLAALHAALKGFVAETSPFKETIKMAAFWDNEEIGSILPGSRFSVCTASDRENPADP